MSETLSERVERKLSRKRRLISVALGDEKADLVLKNATFVNVFSNGLSQGDIAVANGLIVGMGSYSGLRELDVSGKIVCPGFIDAHIHLESSLVTPREFARAVLPNGTTTVITDPHEIANVMGTAGIDYMLAAGENLPLDIHYMLPSCVPATPLDESGAALAYTDIDPYFTHPRVLGLAEMMNYVGVLQGDESAISKIIASQAHHKKIDGHAPGLSGKALNAYISAGVYSDHECFTLENALEKLEKGQFIMIREGTAAKNLDALLPLLCPKYYSRCMFATDDKHPIDLISRGHIDYIARRAIASGVDPIIVIKVASHNAARYFLLNNKGAIAPGYLADFAVIDNFENFYVNLVIKRGEVVYDGDLAPLPPDTVSELLVSAAHNTMRISPVSPSTFSASLPLAVIGIVPGEIVTKNLGLADRADPKNGLVKLAVLERHKNTGHVGLCALKGYGLRSGAIATSISHDSHNIIVAGASDADMALAVNALISSRGGMSVCEDGKLLGVLPLEIAGLMTDKPLPEVNAALESLKASAHTLGDFSGADPFMTLSFMSLPVIPELRLTTRGPFDVIKNRLV